MSGEKEIKAVVRERYSAVAIDAEHGCCSGTPELEKLLTKGYSAEELETLPESVIAMSKGCGNPTALGMINKDDTVLDLGSGGGLDVFLASRKVGSKGKVIGLDMTPEMIQQSVENVKRIGATNVEFKLGEIEQIPLDNESIDVIMSNCVICLSPDKGRVFGEMFRVLRPGGRLAIADELALTPFSDEEKLDPIKWSTCITGAITEQEYTNMLEEAGFKDTYVKRLRERRSEEGASLGVASAFISATKPMNDKAD